MKQNEITAENGQPTTNTGEIILYQPDNSIRLEVRMEEETVWLTQAQMAMLFETSRNNITLHIKNIFKEGELEETAVCKDFLLTAADGKTLDIERHNLQYPSVTARECDRFHDRFLIIDDTVYHLGASLKDLGKKLFAFSRMNVGAEVLSI